MDNQKKGGLPGTPKDRLTFNKTDQYIDAAAPIDLSHGCVAILVDVAADVVTDAATDAVTDAVVDGVADSAADAAADTAADAAADTAADTAADAAADAGADSGAQGGISTACSKRLKTLAIMLGGAIMSTVTTAVANAIYNAIKSAGSTPTTSADYWTALYNSMITVYPCNANNASTCPGNQRDEQEAMVLSLQQQLAQTASYAQSAQTFEESWSAASQTQLKDSLITVTDTGGIPSMCQYMENYTNTGASGAALVIATINVFDTVAAYEYPDLTN
ncbi:hypothetical protein [Deminuibacter soli]|uniref:Uncharacterized protein n=1 Tax=Deminuibacter soli TaxID=2291815 RepID=A0A3E1NEM2_9BACT|nr:hypothetical protein [Deminuibacter soli]RFM26430.1 hypothetical protein DXN05_19565 [Deminuibacter soli]